MFKLRLSKVGTENVIEYIENSEIIKMFAKKVKEVLQLEDVTIDEDMKSRLLVGHDVMVEEFENYLTIIGNKKGIEKVVDIISRYDKDLEDAWGTVKI